MISKENLIKEENLKISQQEIFNQSMSKAGLLNRLQDANMNELDIYCDIDQQVINLWLSEMHFSIKEKAIILSNIVSILKKTTTENDDNRKPSK